MVVFNFGMIDTIHFHALRCLGVAALIISSAGRVLVEMFGNCKAKLAMPSLQIV
jgi:hypothetical protein